jgi:uncharacterized protein
MSHDHTNRLAGEKSPYLLQHAHNPVDWYPWGEEAFARAREEDRPIFLSIGYATCHWCHVMERESFENEEIAALMNELFVNVKVDREEHPDVDQIYMAAVQRISGQGGWPMSVFLTPDLKPFYAGTYYPPEGRYGRPGFPDLLRRIDEFFRGQRAEIESQAQQLTEMLAEASGQRAERAAIEDRTAVDKAVAQLRQSFDSSWGGFGSAPKFPRSMTLMLLLRDAVSAGDPEGHKVAMVERTLEMMWRGGIYDHVGGGFARYSVDDEWLVPHFEKMLYDNALLVIAYLEAAQVTANPDHARVVRETLDWVAEEMTHIEGGFFSALDADSEGEEGKFYVWTPDELAEALGEDDAEFMGAVFDVKPGGNFEGSNVLALRRSLDDSAAALGLSREELESRLDGLRARLYSRRARRIPPLLDDKVLCSWNGLMIAALARAGAQLEEERFLDAARRAARFVSENLVVDGGLMRRWREGEAALKGTLEDYAYFGWGLVELFEATGEVTWLDGAKRWLRRAIDLFGDTEGGGFFMTEADAPHLIVRSKDAYDGATPSGNSVMAFALARLADLRGEEGLRRVAERTVAAFEADLQRYPSAHPLLLCALDHLRAAPEQILLSRGEDDLARGEELAQVLRSSFRPRAVRVELRESDRAALESRLSWVSGKTAEGRSAVWICRDFACETPRFEAEELRLALEKESTR